MATTYNEPGVTYNQVGLTYEGFPVAVEGDALQLYDENLAPIGEINDWEDLQFKDTLNEETAWQFTYPRDGMNRGLMISEKDRFFSAPLPGGGYYWGYIEEDQHELIDESGKYQFAGRGMEGLLDYARVVPPNGVAAAVYPFVTQKAGVILRTLIQAAKLRGAIPQIKIDFTDTTDSSGNAWSTNITIDIQAGSSILDVCKGLASKGWVDWRMTGGILQVYNAFTTMATDRPSVIFRRGIHLQDAQQQRSRKDLATAIVGVGDNDSWTLQEDTTAILARGRKEGYMSFSGASQAMLPGLTQAKLLTSKVVRLANTQTVYYQDYLPFNQFRAGDFVYADLGDEGVQQFRIVDFTYSPWPRPTGQMSLGDRFDDLEIILQDRIDGILGGAGTGSTPVTPGSEAQAGTPQQVTGVALNSIIYQNNDIDGRFFAGLNITWNAVTLNTNNTAVDLDSYEVQRRYQGATSWAIHSSLPDNSLFVDGLVPGNTVEVRVRAKSKSGKLGAFSAITSVVLSDDVTPPEVPSVPDVDQWLGTLIVQWDGLDFAGNFMSADFKEVRVYLAAFNNAPTGGSVVAGSFTRGGGYLVINNLPYDQPWYVRFASVDTSGNESALTTPVSGIPLRIAGPDLQANSITANELQVGSVTAAAIDVGAVNANTATFGASTNMIPDPAFGDATYRAERLTWALNPSRWQFSNFAPLVTGGGYYLEALGNATDATTGFIPLTGYFGIHAGEKYYFKTMYRRFSANVGSGFRFGLELLDANGVSSYLTNDFTIPGAGWLKYETSYRIPDGYVTARVILLTINHTSGSNFFDEMECRNFVGGANAIGSRVEISPLGMFMWDGSDMQTVMMDAKTGDVSIRGQLLSGIDSKRLVLNPTSTYLPEIRFYPTSGDQYAYINAVDGGGGATPFIGVNAPDAGGPPLRGFKLILTDTSMFVGEFQQFTLTSTGTAVVSDQGDGYMYLVGRVPGAALNTRAMLMGGRFTVLNGAGSAGGTTSTAISKPTLSGLSIPMFSLHRGTLIFFRYHIDAHSTGSWSVRWENHATLDNVTTFIHWILFRGDDL